MIEERNTDMKEHIKSEYKNKQINKNQAWMSRKSVKLEKYQILIGINEKEEIQDKTLNIFSTKS